MTYFSYLTKTDSSATTIIIRIMVGSVFLAEGIQKFLYPAARGAGRFEGMEFPAPEFFGPFQARELFTYGFWAMAHEMHTDFAMFLGSLFLIIKGGGQWSLDSA